MDHPEFCGNESNEKLSGIFSIASETNNIKSEEF